MKNVLLVVTLLVAFFLGACSKDDGDWTPMRWKTSVVKEKDGKIAVPTQGGSYVFVCTNYNKPWMSNLKEIIDGKETYYNIRWDDNLDSNHSITSPWLTAQWNANTLTVTVEPNETGKEREMDVTVTAGDIFYTFTFKQAANK